MSAGLYNITIEQGADYTLDFLWTNSLGAPINLSGRTARMQIRESVTSKTPLLNLTSANGGITLGGDSGTVLIVATSAQTQAIKYDPALLIWQDGKEGVVYVYDLEVVDPNGKVRRLLQGSVFFVPEVTR